MPTLAGEWCDTHDKVSLTQLFKQLPKIQQIKLYLERKGKAKVTVATYTKALKELAKRANLDKTTEVETAIAHYKKTNGLECSKKWKRQLCIAYSHYCKNNKIHWDEQPTYKTHEHSIQPPSKEKCLMLMSSAKGTLSLKIAISIHTGLRPTEITGNEHGLKVRDIHPDTKTITPTSAKGCNARPPIKIPQELATRLLTYIIKNDLKPDDRLFKENPRSYGNSFAKMRNRLSKRLNDPTIRNIRLYDFRHRYITDLLRKIGNAEIVRQKVGHKRLNTTQKYLHLISNEECEYIVESTTDQKRADELLEQGFNYVLTTPDGYMKFRKPK